MDDTNNPLSGPLYRWMLEVFAAPAVLAWILIGLQWTASGWVQTAPALQWVSFGLALLVFAPVCALLCVSLFFPKLGHAGELLVPAAAILIVAFLFLCEAVFRIWGSIAFRVDVPVTLEDYAWFTLQNIGGSVLLDLVDVYGFKFSRIEHVTSFWPSTLIFSFRTAIGFGMLSGLLRSLIDVHRNALSETSRRHAEESV